MLGRNAHVYDRLCSVLVYPSQFVVSGEWHDEHGVVTEESRVLAGESWDVSRVILSWEDVDSRGAPGEAYNVVIHEFAHCLDHESGGAPSLLEPYAAEDRGEFFAVASEAFFEEPAAFARELPALYRAPAGVYRLDPAAW